MRDTRRFRERIIEFCQAPLPAAGGMLHDHPELLSDLAEQQLSLLCDVTGESADWRSQATFRRKWALIVRARAVGVQHAVAEAEAAQRGDLTDEAWDALSRAVDALRAYERSGSMNSLAHEIASWEALLSHPMVHWARTVRSLALLSSAELLLERWYRGGRVADLDTAIERWQQVIADMGPEPRWAPSVHDNLALAYLARYGAAGALADLAAAVNAAEYAVAEAADDDDNLPKFRTDLAGALQDRYAATGDIADLDRAIGLYEDVVGDTEPGDRVADDILNNFATALSDRFSRTGEPADHNRAEQLSRRAVDATPTGSTDYAGHLSNLASYVADAAEQLLMRRQALSAGSASQSRQAGHMYNLAMSLLNSYPGTSSREALDEAIDLLEQAIEATDPSSPDYVRYCLGCGQARRIAFMAAADYEGQLAELERGTVALGGAIELGLEKAPELALAAARYAGSWYTEIEVWELAALAYAQGLDAADLLVRVQLRRVYKENWLRTVGNLPSEAAYAAARTGELRVAVLDMERGRAVLLAEALGLRDADMERLRADGHVRLHSRFNALVARWNDLSTA